MRTLSQRRPVHVTPQRYSRRCELDVRRLATPLAGGGTLGLRRPRAPALGLSSARPRAPHLERHFKWAALSLLLLLALLVGAGCSHAPPAPVAHGAVAAVAEASGVLAPPPPAGSDDAKADLAVVLWLQRTRSADDVARATREIVLDLGAYAAAFGPGFDADAHPRTRELLDLVHARATRPILDAKKRFARPRPYQADARVAPAVEREHTFSYPSSHATRGVLVARVLAELAPAQREALLEAGLRAGYDRVVAGVHYPSDVLAGQRLGAALAEALLSNPDVRAKLEAARAAEWRPAPGR